MKEEKKLIEGAKTIVLLTDKGAKVDGESAMVLTLITSFLKSLIDNGADKELVKKSIDLAFLSDEELKIAKKEAMKNFLENLKKQLDE